jgi:hypothetical protein
LSLLAPFEFVSQRKFLGAGDFTRGIFGKALVWSKVACSKVGSLLKSSFAIKSSGSECQIYRFTKKHHHSWVASLSESLDGQIRLWLFEVDCNDEGSSIHRTRLTVLSGNLAFDGLLGHGGEFFRMSDPSRHNYLWCSQRHLLHVI